MWPCPAVAHHCFRSVSLAQHVFPTDKFPWLVPGISQPYLHEMAGGMGTFISILRQYKGVRLSYLLPAPWFSLVGSLSHQDIERQGLKGYSGVSLAAFHEVLLSLLRIFCLPPPGPTSFFSILCLCYSGSPRITPQLHF